jgi:hypothetical protein
VRVDHGLGHNISVIHFLSLSHTNRFRSTDLTSGNANPSSSTASGSVQVLQVFKDLTRPDLVFVQLTIVGCVWQLCLLNKTAMTSLAEKLHKCVCVSHTILINPAELTGDARRILIRKLIISTEN